MQGNAREVFAGEVLHEHHDWPKHKHGQDERGQNLLSKV